jgi:large subunit ribosomal protein L13e|tara:strand:+ start:115 stop:792 length:678 start_codon:yes stop_codon:yes gene_type:complete
MVKNNNIIPNAHFKKDWQTRVKCWFNQPARKKRRRLARQAKAARVAPRPVAGPLRPVVRCPTIKYNMRVRQGRGFTLEELKTAGINAKEALNIGIAVDHRRRNKNMETLSANVARLKAYKERLVLFPRRSGEKNKRTTASSGLMATSAQTDLQTASQLKGEILPITQASKDVEWVDVSDEMKANSAYLQMRTARNNARTIGAKAKALIIAAEEAKAKKGKKKKKK